MANIDTGGGGGKGKPKRLNLRVDFTPMVDMNMLLLTFFMFCSTLSKPQIMDIAMPTNDENIEETEKNKIPESRTITLLLGEDNKVYYYQGKPNYDEYNSLKVTDFGPDGLRAILLDHNTVVHGKMKELKAKKRENRKMTDDEFNKEAKEIKSSDKASIIVIKATEDSKYANLVDALDEMAICSVGKYAIVKMAEGDEYLLENLKTQGAYGAERQSPDKKK